MSSPDTPLHPAELSAYLDGELPPGRSREIEAQLAQDPALRAEYEVLRALDARWREAAGDATFTPAVSLPAIEPRTVRLTPIVAAVLVLLLARVGGKFVEAVGPSLLLNLAAMALVVVTLLATARQDPPQAAYSLREGKR